MTEFVEILLRRDIHTDLGILPRGSTQQATPADDDQWLVRVTDTLTVPVPERSIWAGRAKRLKLQTVREVHEEYEFACDALGFSHAGAVKWVQERYRVEERQMNRWGLYIDGPREVAS